jgi:predicted transglutaminase-like cysteine proteinase
MLRRQMALACAAVWAQPMKALGETRSLKRVLVSGPPLRRAWEEFEALADEAARFPLRERFAWVNDAINRRVVHADDAEQFGDDVWLTPLETLALCRGDCEDSAISKFFLLLAAGSPPSALRLLYARHRPPATPGVVQAHVVALARLPFVDPLALDSLDPLAVALSHRSDLEPVLSFDRDRLWLGAQGRDCGCAPARLRPWRDLLARIDAQPRWRTAQRGDGP